MSVNVEQLYREHGHVALRRARRLLEDEDQAMEAVHQVFLSLVERPSQYRGRSAFTTWLYSATTHYCLNQLRNRRTRRSLLANRQGSNSVAVPDQQGPDGETAVMIKDLLARLPDTLAQVAVLYCIDEMTHDEIATVMGCSRRKVGKLVERLRNHHLVKELR
jgi:RNA polymerase sigma-70 factor (ECF subfamily)